jgi:methylphosphotriester-DNA--protein-cysteine methyltransferase
MDEVGASNDLLGVAHVGVQCRANAWNNKQQEVANTANSLNDANDTNRRFERPVLARSPAHRIDVGNANWTEPMSRGMQKQESEFSGRGPRYFSFCKTMKTKSKGKAMPRRGDYLSDDRRWKAVLRRDPNADGKFYYSVKTTGVYCRPSCAAPLARRENVAFHSSCAQAEKAGFRPCKRCQPNAPTLEEQYATTVTRACRIITTAEEAPKLDVLARLVGMSPFHFHRMFKRMVGLTPKAYASAHRAERMRKELPRHNSVTEAIYNLVLNQQPLLREVVGDTRMVPNCFRTGGGGATIRFAVQDARWARSWWQRLKRGVRNSSGR